MNLVSIRIITENIDNLINFYEQVSGFSVVRYTPDFAELQTKTATLAIGSINTLQFFGGEVLIQSTKNTNVFIEFMVDDVDKDFERLADLLQYYIIQKPTVMPWGNKSLLFHDPDGNLVNLFTPISPEAVQKF